MTDTLDLVLAPVGEILQNEGEYAIGAAKLKTAVASLYARSASIVSITSAEDHERAVQAGRALQTQGKEVETFFKPYKQQVDEVKRRVLDDERAARDLLTVEKERLGKHIQVWETEQERLRQKQLVEDREAARKADEDDRLAEAVSLAAQGFHEDAEALLEAPTLPPPVIAQRVVAAKTPGKVTRRKYSAKVENFRVMVRAVSEGKVPLEALLPNESFLNKQANAFREALDYPGVSVETDTTTHFRSAR